MEASQGSANPAGTSGHRISRDSRLDDRGSRSAGSSGCVRSRSMTYQGCDSARAACAGRAAVALERAAVLAARWPSSSSAADRAQQRGTRQRASARPFAGAAARRLRTSRSPGRGLHARAGEHLACGLVVRAWTRTCDGGVLCSCVGRAASAVVDAAIVGQTRPPMVDAAWSAQRRLADERR